MAFIYLACICPVTTSLLLPLLLFRGFRDFLVPLLVRLLERDPRDRMDMEEFFEVTELFFAKQPVYVFNTTVGQHLRVYIEPMESVFE